MVRTEIMTQGLNTACRCHDLWLLEAWLQARKGKMGWVMHHICHINMNPLWSQKKEANNSANLKKNISLNWTTALEIPRNFDVEESDVGVTVVQTNIDRTSSSARVRFTRTMEEWWDTESRNHNFFQVESWGERFRELQDWQVLPNDKLVKHY